MIEQDEINPVDEHRRWTQELKLASDEDKKWVKRGDKIVKRYRDERQGYSDSGKRYNILSNYSALTALVSTRINPLRIPQESAFPAISYNLVSVIASPTNTSHSRTDFARVQVNSFGATFSDAIRCTN